MDTKHIHCMLEDMSKYGKEMISCMVGDGNVNLQDLGEIIDIVKDLACAEKDALIAKEMRKAHEEDEAEEKHFIKMLKDQYKDEYREMKEQYGEEADKRFYDSWRHADGSFARKGTGEYRPRSYYRRRGYVEPMYHMPLNMYHDYSPEELRDLDRDTRGVMYYTPMSSGNAGVRTGNSGSNSANMDGNSGGSARGYEDGFDEGQRRGYSESYEQGSRDGESRGRSQGGRRDGREGRSGQSRRSYMETKEMNKGNTPQEKQEKMKELEKYMKELAEDVTEMIEDATPEERSLAKQKMQILLQKL